MVATEAKPFASLSSGLLARKGAARPAMRPQGFGQIGGGLEDLGWDDMGFEAPKAVEVPRDEDHDAFGDDVVNHPRSHPTGLTPVGSPVHGQQAEIVERFNGADEEPEEDEIDETAELGEPETQEVPAAPVVVAAAAGRSGAGSTPCAASSRCCGKQGEGGVYAPPRSQSSSETPARLRRRRKVGAAAGY